MRRSSDKPRPASMFSQTTHVTMRCRHRQPRHATMSGARSLYAGTAAGARHCGRQQRHPRSHPRGRHKTRWTTNMADQRPSSPLTTRLKQWRLTADVIILGWLSTGDIGRVASPIRRRAVAESLRRRPSQRPTLRRNRIPLTRALHADRRRLSQRPTSTRQSCSGEQWPAATEHR